MKWIEAINNDGEEFTINLNLCGSVEVQKFNEDGEEYFSVVTKDGLKLAFPVKVEYAFKFATEDQAREKFFETVNSK